MNASDLFKAGKLQQAIDAQTAEVKSAPADPAKRTFLFELLCFAGELDRAEKQLAVVAQGGHQAEWAVQVYTNILHAERSRRRLFSDGQKPEFLRDPPDYAHYHFEAINCLREDQHAEASELLRKSAEMWPTLQGERNGQPFQEFRDSDDVLAPFLEIIILRDYAWLALEHLQELEVMAPERPRDLIWAPARMVLTDGTQQRAYLPVLYPNTHEQPDEQLKLGRMTDWRAAEDGPVRGIGQRVFLADDEEVAVLEARHVTFKPSSAD